MRFMAELRWMLRYKKNHPKADKEALEVALRLKRMQEIYKDGKFKNI